MGHDSLSLRGRLRCFQVLVCDSVFIVPASCVSECISRPPQGIRGTAIHTALPVRLARGFPSFSHQLTPQSRSARLSWRRWPAWGWVTAERHPRRGASTSVLFPGRLQQSSGAEQRGCLRACHTACGWSHCRVVISAVFFQAQRLHPVCLLQPHHPPAGILFLQRHR